MSQMDYKYRVNFVKGTTDKWDEYVKIFDNNFENVHNWKLKLSTAEFRKIRIFL